MHNSLTAPLAYPSGDHYPAGWVRPDPVEAMGPVTADLEEKAEEGAKDNLVAPKVTRIAESVIQHGAEQKLSTEPAQPPAEDGKFAASLPRVR